MCYEHTDLREYFNNIKEPHTEEVGYQKITWQNWTTTIFRNLYREYLREFCIMHTAPAVTHNNIYEFGAMKIQIYENSLTIGKPQN